VTSPEERVLPGILHGTSDVFLLVHRDDGTVLDVSDSYLELTGFSRAEVVGRSTVELGMWPDREHRDRFVADLMVSRRVSSVMRELPTKSGDIVLVEVSSHLTDVDGEPAILTVKRDVTESARAGQGLRESEERFRLLSEASFEGVAIHEEGSILAVNQAFADMFGYASEELIGMSAFQLAPPESHQTIIEGIRTGREEAYEVVGLRKDGSTFPALVRGRMAPFQGRTVRIVAIRDFTEHKLVEQELQWALDAHREVSARVRQLDEMKRTFLWAVSHELRTPLAGVLWVAEALQALQGQDRGLSPEETTELIGLLVSNARTLDRLLADLLDLSQAERGRRPRPSVDIADLARRTIATSPALQSMDTEVSGGPVVAAVDVPSVERIVENLVANAHRHTPPGTSVVVRVEPHPDGVLLAVEDEGPGIPDEEKESVFEPFRKASGSRSASVGMGIGLSLVRRFAELHDGRAWVEDRPGGGASFQVILPVSPTILLPADGRPGDVPENG